MTALPNETSQLLIGLFFVAQGTVRKVHIGIGELEKLGGGVPVWIRSLAATPQPQGEAQRINSHVWQRRYNQGLVVVNLPGVKSSYEMTLQHPAKDILTGQSGTRFTIFRGMAASCSTTWKANQNHDREKRVQE